MFAAADFVVAKALGARAVDLFAQRRFDAGPVLRRVDRRHAPLAEAIQAGHRQSGTGAVAQPVLFANARRQPRVDRTAEQIVGQHQRRVVGVIVAQVE